MLCNALIVLQLSLVAQTSRPAVLLPVQFDQVRAELRAQRTTFNVGEPIWVEFVVHNRGQEAAELVVPGAAVADKPPADGQMGLPIEHVFGGSGWRALSVSDGVRKRLGDDVRRPPAGAVRSIRLAGHSSVGLRVDVGRFYSALRQTGQYRLLWRPYGGLVKSNELMVRVEVLKQVLIRTNLGDMIVHLLYDKAAQHVANFLELAGQGFYNGLTFHRVVGGALIQGGDPRGDGTGSRADGKMLEPEFNDTPFEEGTLGMALAPGDPASASCQFFVCLRRVAALDGEYTAFGRVVGHDSLETLRRIGSVRTDESDRPVQTVRIDKVVVQPVPSVWRAEW